MSWSRHETTWHALQGGLDHRVSGAIITFSECAALLAAFVIVLSMLGVNVNALLLPAGVALAFAAKDLSHNFLAGVRSVWWCPRFQSCVSTYFCSASPWPKACHVQLVVVSIRAICHASVLCRVLSVCCAAIQAGRQSGCELHDTISRQ